MKDMLQALRWAFRYKYSLVFSILFSALVAALEHHVTDYPTPRNLNYWWNFGSLAMFMLAVMIFSGIFLAMNYTPHVTMAFDSCLNVATYVDAILPGLMRRTMAVASIARKQAVPDALSQFISKSAAYCVGCLATGGICVMTLCSPGTMSRLSPVGASGSQPGWSACVH